MDFNNFQALEDATDVCVKRWWETFLMVPSASFSLGWRLITEEIQECSKAQRKPEAKSQGQ